MKTTNKSLPLRKSSSKGPISKGTVKPAQPAGFPTQQSSSYRTMRPPQNLKGGSAGLKPVPVRPKKK